MTEQHPITPPPELVQQWADEAWKGWRGNGIYEQDIATQAARWGSDQELEACCEWFQEFYKTESWVDLDLRTFRTARRPQPPSLKEQALEALMKANGADHPVPVLVLSLDEAAVIRRALEELDD